MHQAAWLIDPERERAERLRRANSQAPCPTISRPTVSSRFLFEHVVDTNRSAVLAHQYAGHSEVSMSIERDAP